jgi:hypothetical protein
MDFEKKRLEYYGGRQQFMRAVKVNRVNLSESDVRNIEGNTGSGCMAGVERFGNYLEMLGLEIVVQPIESGKHLNAPKKP